MNSREYGMLPDNKPAAQVTHCAMGTVITHKAFGLYAEDCLKAVCGEIIRMEGLYSRFSPDSEVSRVNRSAGIKSEKISFETYAVLTQALEFSRYCPGCFDVTIEPLATLWNIGQEPFVQPDELRIKHVLPLVNYRDLILDPREKTAGLRHVGQSVDLGGIGKGFAGDKILEVFKNFGITSAYSNIGGNVVALGTKPDGSPWRIGIQHPRQADRLIGSVSVANRSVAKSGDYQRYVKDSRGNRHHHILNPSTGYPSNSGLVSVSIVTEKSSAADALSTIVFVAGMDKGLEVVRGFPQTEAVLVDSDLRVYITQGLKYRFRADKDIKVKILN